MLFRVKNIVYNEAENYVYERRSKMEREEKIPYGYLTDAGFLGVIGYDTKWGKNVWRFFETEGEYDNYVKEAKGRGNTA